MLAKHEMALTPTRFEVRQKSRSQRKILMSTKLSGAKKHLWRHPMGYWYVRLRGRYHRIDALEGSAEFDRQYWQILSRSAEFKSHSLEDLIVSYRASARWAALRPRTRADYEKVLLHMGERFGAWPADRLKRQHLISEMEASRHRVRFANYTVQVTSVLFEHGLDLGWVEQNPARGIRKLKMPPNKRKVHTPWPDWAVERFRAEASPLPRLIFELGVGSVQRPGDLPRFRWADFDGQSLKIVQSKTGHALCLPCTERLARHLRSAPRSGMTIISGKDGQRLSYFTIARIMRDERRRLGLLDFDLHALRYRGIMELAWANCTDDEIAAISGHATTAMIRKYAGAARQEMRAKSATDKRDNRQRSAGSANSGIGQYAINSLLDSLRSQGQVAARTSKKTAARCRRFETHACRSERQFRWRAFSMRQLQRDPDRPATKALMPEAAPPPAPWLHIRFLVR